MENSKHYQRIKLEPHGDTITTTANHDGEVNARQIEGDKCHQ